MTTCMLLLFVPTQMKAATDAKQSTTIAVSASEAITVNTQIARLEEISDMDMSTLSRTEKNELRSEVRAIKNEMDEQTNKDAKTATNDGTVYISVGGSLLLIIILLLILL